MSPLDPAVATLLDRIPVGTLATESKSGHPRQSLVYFARDGERLLITTDANRFKTRDVRRTGWASLSVRAEEPPYPSATLSGPAEVLTAGIGGPTAAVMQRVLGAEEPPPEQSDEALAEVGRVVLALTIERVSAAAHLDRL